MASHINVCRAAIMQQTHVACRTGPCCRNRFTHHPDGLSGHSLAACQRGKADALRWPGITIVVTLPDRVPGAAAIRPDWPEPLTDQEQAVRAHAARPRRAQTAWPAERLCFVQTARRLVGRAWCWRNVCGCGSQFRGDMRLCNEFCSCTVWGNAGDNTAVAYRNRRIQVMQKRRREWPMGYR